MRKKLCVLGLCLVLSSTCVTGCGGESQPSKKINLETATETDLCPDISSIFSNPDLISNVGVGNMQMYLMRNINY